MQQCSKRVDDLDVADFERCPIWEYEDNGASNDNDRQIHPVKDLPVTSLRGRIAGVQVKFKNGTVRWAALSNVSLTSPKKTKHFLAVWIEQCGRWFELARYFDVDYNRRGPGQLAAFVGMPIEDVFPISYDLTGIAHGDAAALKGLVEADPHERLSEDEIIALALVEAGDGVGSP